MNLEFTEADRIFRDEVRAFFQSELPEHLATRQRQGFYLSGEDMKLWQSILYRRGWAAPHWPKAYGGTGWSATQRYLFEDETGLFDAPDPAVVGINLVGPIIYTFGSDLLKQKFIKPILSGEWMFCQGFSEPGAGSDLASLRTRAVRDGNDWIISGQKIWTSEAQFADHMICLVRTNADVRPQAGLSMVMIDMTLPGVRVVPIRTINSDHVVNEVFLDDVRVPADHLIGALDQGWSYAKFLLGNERTYNAHVNRLKRDAQLIRIAAGKTDRHGRRLLDDPGFRARLERFEIDVMALDWSVLRALHAGDEVSRGDIAAASGLKIVGSELQLRASELEIEALGLHALPIYRNPAREPYGDKVPSAAPHHAPGITSRYLYRRAATVFGGSNDIQRAIIWGGALASN